MTKPGKSRLCGKRLHFVGIGGAGMAPLAHLALRCGAAVSGSDEKTNGKTAALAQEGARIYPCHAAENLPADADILIHSSAVPPENPERRLAAERRIPQLRRGEFLAEFLREYPRVAAVSGSHGKSTITAMLARILDRCGKNPGWMIGAEPADFPASETGGGDLFVTEADESDGTHTALTPWLGIVPGIDDDHAWGLGGAEALYRNFASFARQSDRLLFFGGETTDRLLAGHPCAVRLEPPRAGFRFAGFSGFQAADAMIAVEAAAICGVPREDAAAALKDFGGIARRMTVRFRSGELTIIEDYAHHPAEVKASLELLRETYPGAELRVLFQPHRYARLKRYFAEFAEILRNTDRLIVAPTFAAWCETGEVDHRALAAAIPGAAAADNDWRRTASLLLAPSPRRGVPVVAAVIGAGDLDQVFAYLPGNKKSSGTTCNFADMDLH